MSPETSSATSGQPAKQSSSSHLLTGVRPWAAAALLLLLVFFYIRSLEVGPVVIRRWAPSNLVPATITTAVPPPPTNLSHLVFGIVSSSTLLEKRKPYVEAWWRPNVTRGYMFLDKYPDNRTVLCPDTCPTVRINDDISAWKLYDKKDVDPLRQVRQVRSIVETFRQGDNDVRWYVMADDDSVLFLDNIVEVLSKYDHTKYYYLGSQGSETILSNAHFAFNMGFGGAGLVLSYPLAAALSKTLDGCIKRYPQKWSADFYTYVCIAALGVTHTPQKGFHQIDLHGDLSGLLSSHPQAPLLSLHHVDFVDPIFPNMTQYEAIRHLLKPASLDQSRLLQQFICYHHDMNWSISVSWGYSVHIYESIIARAFLQRPIETFGSWIKNAKFPKFAFNTRALTNNSCETPHVFFFDTIEINNAADDPTTIVTTYKRAWPRGLEACADAGNHSADGISKISVISPANSPLEDGRIECCDLAMADKTTATVTLRRCKEAEEIV